MQKKGIPFAKNTKSHDDFCELLAQFYVEMIKPEFEEVKKGINKLDKRISQVYSLML